MRISDWSSDVCSSDLVQAQRRHHAQADVAAADVADVADRFLQRSQALDDLADFHEQRMRLVGGDQAPAHQGEQGEAELGLGVVQDLADRGLRNMQAARGGADRRSEEHTSELQSLMRISYAVFCLKKKKKKTKRHKIRQ